jgi:predicted RNA-binding Zn-ribbon protein involved in translation (DUF1610 family)
MRVSPRICATTIVPDRSSVAGNPNVAQPTQSIDSRLLTPVRPAPIGRGDATVPGAGEEDVEECPERDVRARHDDRIGLPGGRANVETESWVTRVIREEATMAFTCPVCGGEFDSLEALEAHTRADHPGEGKARVVCPACGAELGSQEELDAHARAEHGAA